jgi:anti-sigma B factor antagonist
MDPYQANSIEVEELGKALLVRLRGEWDSCVAGKLAEAFEGIGDLRDLYVDLRGVVFIDSTALSQLLRLHKRIKCAGRSFETISSKPVLRLFQLTSLDRLLEAPPERVAWIDAAARSLGNRPFPLYGALTVAEPLWVASGD